VIRALTLEAHGYKVTITELVGWEHSAKNELILGKRVHRYSTSARAQLRALLERFQIEPAIVRALAARGLDPRGDPTVGPNLEPNLEPNLGQNSDPSSGSNVEPSPEPSPEPSVEPT